jgi:hypothetical protein
MTDSTIYHTKNCNSKRGPQYPCDCSEPKKTMNRETIETALVRAAMAESVSWPAEQFRELAKMALASLRYKAALEWYENEVIYENTISEYKSIDSGKSYGREVTPAIISDRGQRARKALQGTGGEG